MVNQSASSVRCLSVMATSTDFHYKRAMIWLWMRYVSSSLYKTNALSLKSMTSHVSRVAEKTRRSSHIISTKKNFMANICMNWYWSVKLCVNITVANSVKFVTRFRFCRAFIEHSNIPHSKVYRRWNYGTSQILMFASMKR